MENIVFMLEHILGNFLNGPSMQKMEKLFPLSKILLEIGLSNFSSLLSLAKMLSLEALLNHK